MQYEQLDKGRYEDNVAKYLHKLATTEPAGTIGDTKGNGWKAMLVALSDDDQKEVQEAGHGYDGAVSAIVIEDDQGYITVEVYTSDEEAGTAWEAYKADATEGDGEERRGKDTPGEDSEGDEPVAASADGPSGDEGMKENAQSGVKYAAAGANPLALGNLVRKQLPTQGECAHCGREGRVFMYGTRNPVKGQPDWQKNPFCSAACMRSFNGMSESKRSNAGQRVGLGLRLIEAGVAPSAALDKVLSGNVMTEQEALYMAIQSGDTITIAGPDGQKVSGVAVKKTADGWVLDVAGGQGMATKDTVVSVDVAQPMAPDMGPEMGDEPPVEPMGDEVGAAAGLPDLSGDADEDEMPSALDMASPDVT